MQACDCDRAVVWSARGAEGAPPRDRARGADRLDQPREPRLVRGARLAADDRYGNACSRSPALDRRVLRSVGSTARAPDELGRPLAAVLVRLGLALVEGDAQAAVADDVLASGVLAHVAHLDLLAASLALRFQRDHFGGIPRRTASVR